MYSQVHPEAVPYQYTGVQLPARLSNSAPPPPPPQRSGEASFKQHTRGVGGRAAEPLLRKEVGGQAGQKTAENGGRANNSWD